MAQKGVHLDRKGFSCFICLDLLKEPVNIPCGHSYCTKCIEDFWDGEDYKRVYSCPECRKTFKPRPVPENNIILAVLIEQLKTREHQAAPAEHSYAGPEDVACDFCTGRKLKAIKSCLMCEVSYCEKHVQPHDHVARLRKHQLVEPSKTLHKSICSRHDEVMRMFCRTDQQIICHVCMVDEHIGHDIISAAAERREKQKERQARRAKRKELQMRRENIQQRIQYREKDATAAESQPGHKLQNTWANIVVRGTEGLRPEPKSRADFLRRSCDVTLDPNTAHGHLRGTQK
ncbi:E3 ubiquitin/ISG15 ligase TRIM25-like [Nematolebias whitei]|uniref:E3 ubiquitin/ISG15 ligase TRIM25-like n=1 Tax=Nematolebias whitei TaxID=451745 RepID=UPI001899BB84|nr:E3 ubiquitin/ISG15 ligase TRIM25-like [Nematolebias whitei]